MFNPCGDNIIVSPSKAEEAKTESGLILPDSVTGSGQITTGTVVVTGPGHLCPETGVRGEMLCKKGDTVWYAKGHASTIKLDGKEYKVVAERNIFGYHR